MAHVDLAVKRDHYMLNEPQQTSEMPHFPRLSQQQQKFRHEPFKFTAIKMNNGHLQC